MTGKEGGRDVIIEFMKVGNSVKVSAIDPKTMVEVSIVGDPRSSKESLKRLAIQKLEYMLARRDGQEKE